MYNPSSGGYSIRQEQHFNGGSTVYTLSSAPGGTNNLDVFISGVAQTPGIDYTVSGATLTFSSAPPAGTNNVVCRWGIGVSGSANYSAWDNNRFLGDGITTSFVLSSLPGGISNLDLSVDGLTLVPDIDFTLSGATVNFVTAPAFNAEILARWGAATGNYATWVEMKFSGNGSTSNFTLPSSPGQVGNLDVSINGVTQYAGVSYTLSGNTLTFTPAPPSGTDNIFVRYSQSVPVAGSPTYSELVSSGGTALLGNQVTGSSTTRLLSNKINEFISVKDFGAVGDGVANDTAAIQAAINSFPAGDGTVYFPPGVYKVTSQITVAQNRMHLRGAGSGATQLLFAPTAAQTCIKLSAGASVLFQGSITGMRFYSNDSTWAKVAIDMVDTSGYLIDDIAVGGSVVAVAGSTFWSGGAASTGLLLRGREACKLSRLYIYADKPIRVSDNPNSSIDIDHFHFEDTYLAAANNPCVTIDSGVNLTNVTFDGYNAWVLGTDGLYWVDTTTSQVSQTLVLRGVRWEQGQNAASWCIRIEHNSQLQGLTIEDCQGGLERNGYRLRKCLGINIRNNLNSGAAGRTVLDVDSTVSGLSLSECLWQVGASASMVGQVLVWGVPNQQSNAPLPPTARYQSSTIADKRTRTEMANGGYMVTVANGAVVGLGPSTMAGMLTVVDSEYLSAIFNIRGTGLVVSEVADPAAVFSVTSGAASTTNIYWSAGNNRYELQNNRGASRNYLIVFDGTYTSF